MTDRTGRGPHPEHQILHFQRPQVIILDGGDHVAV
jgi:hypothetical protein